MNNEQIRMMKFYVTAIKKKHKFLRWLTFNKDQIIRIRKR